MPTTPACIRELVYLINSSSSQRLMGVVDGGLMNGVGGANVAGGGDYQQWMEEKEVQGKVSPQTQRHGGEVFSNTLPVRKAAPAKSKTTLSR